MSQLHMEHHNLVRILTHIHKDLLEEILDYHILEISERYTRLQNHLTRKKKLRENNSSFSECVLNYIMDRI